MTLTDSTRTRTAAAPASPRAFAGIRTWTEPEHLTARGTVLVLVGRGETPEVYERLGRRLATDAYRVVVVDEGPDAAAVVAGLLAADDLPAPRVLLGSDTGARTAVAVARDTGPGPDALVLAGLPTSTAIGAGPWGGSWQSELEARTSCPNHRAVLGRAARGGLAESVLGRALPDLGLDAPAEASEVAPLGVPVLAVHGGADPISPVGPAVAAYRALGTTEVVVVEGALHDVLNDVQHRSVAATLVLFLERLRLGTDLPAVVRPAADGTLG